MIVRPAQIEDLKAALAEAQRRGERIQRVEFQGFDGLVEYNPEDMTATVQAGMTLSALQEILGKHRQWLPLDPPSPDRLTIGQLISANASGPRRYGEGTVRDYLIGMTVVLADGRVIKSGGKVVKNVAGYDLCKLFVGNRDTLGITVEATFKVKPLPESERFVEKALESLDEAGALLDSVLESDLTPTVIDLHQLDTANNSAPILVLGFSGAREEIEHQLKRAGELGITQPGTLDHEQSFWSISSALPVRQVSVLPSELTKFIRTVGAVSWIARAGNGLVHYRGGAEPPRLDLPLDLLERVKATFDPKQILPDLWL